jgi:S-DNA-T family DNA segregation ATPase FtsK/SpoIIIE
MAQKSGAPKTTRPASQPGIRKPDLTDTQPVRLDRTLRAMTRFQRFFWDIGGVLVLALALMTLLALLVPSWSGGLLKWWVETLQLWFGWGSVWVLSIITVAGLWMLSRRKPPETQRVAWGRVMALELTAFTSIALMAVLGGISIERAEARLDGGRVGWGLAELLRMALESIGLTGVFWQAFVLTVLLLIGLAVGLGVVVWLRAWLRRLSSPALPTADGFSSPGLVVSEAPLQGGKIGVGSALTQPGSSAQKKRPALPPQFRKSFRVQPEAEQPVAPRSRDERLPPLDLLAPEQGSRQDERNINLTAGLIEKTLAEFGIPAKVIGFKVGPTVTQFAVEPGFVEKDKANGEGEAARQKVRVAQISNLSRDLALALSADRLRIEAPVPGRPYVGIEVPNARFTIVRLRPLLESEAFYKVASPLAIALGRDVSGQPVVADLGSMPHLLVAGTTGSGKSVCIAAITACLVMNNTPDDLRLVMIDPKMVELVRFNGLPHLLGKVETEIERILAVLRWAVVEMDRRYKVLEAAHARNIDTYNRKARRRPGIEYLPRIVVMIDELADLMMSAPDQTEHNLVRLAQMARATGIHLVIATQRPSTDVVTGLIKANFPARISFAVASSVDSRVILDTVGAETLLGRGDMLFTPPEISAPIRSQGAMISDQEIERLITFWQKVHPTSAATEPSPWEMMLQEEETLADRDGLVNKAIAIVRDTQRASASMLQRRLRVGYPRAARLIDELEDLGVVGPAQGGGREREVLIGKDDEINFHSESR